MSKRDIRSFFKPLPTNVQPSRELEQPAPTSSSRSNAVPSARLKSRPLGSPSPRSTASSTPSVKQLNKPPTTDTQKTPETVNAGSRPPSTSQSSTNSSGASRVMKRVLSNGEPVVLNSDSDSDSDGLLELDVDQTANKVRPSRTALRATRFAPYIELQENGLRRPSDKHKRPKASLNKFVQGVREKDEEARRVAEGKAELEKPIEESPPPGLVITEDTLVGHIDDDGDGDTAKRIFQAMQRSDALDTICVFRLFREDLDSGFLQDSPFPTRCLPNQGWATQFDESSDRDEAFCSGFAQQVFQYQQLPVELASWMIDEVCRGPNEVLATKYMQLLEAHPRHLHTLLDRSKLETIFKVLGADLQSLNSAQEIVPSRENISTPKRPLPAALKWVVLLIQKAAQSPSFKLSSHALYVLVHMCVDYRVMSDAGTLHVVQDTIELLLRNAPNAELTPLLNEILPLLLIRITHPILQNSLICSLPSKSPLSAYFQRYLALSFILYPTQLRYSLSSPKIPALIHTHLQNSPSFKTTRDTDYLSLAARISLLDTGIGPGPLTVPYQIPPAPTESQELSLPVSDSSEEVAFNKEVDALANQIKLLSNDIVEVGAIDDLTRLDAKDCCERLFHRLENAVRCGGRKTMNVFEDSVQEGSKKLFQRFLGLKKVGLTTVANGKVGGDVNGAYVYGDAGS